MAKKKPIRVKMKQGPFGLTPVVIGGSRESRYVVTNMIYHIVLTEGPFGADGHYHTPEEWEDILNNAIEEIGYSTEV